MRDATPKPKTGDEGRMRFIADRIIAPIALASDNDILPLKAPERNDIKIVCNKSINRFPYARYKLII